MITGFLLQITLTLLTWIIGLLPVFSIPSQWFAAVGFIWGVANSLSWLLPIPTLLQVLTIALTIHVAVFVWHLAIKLYHMLPFNH